MTASFIRSALPIVRRSLRWGAAVVMLAFLAIAANGSNVRATGEVNALIQSPGARPVALLMLATPLVLSIGGRRSKVKA
jgi:hypothetical protein